MTKMTPVEMLRTAAATYIAAPHSESLRELSDAWNSNAKKLRADALQQIIAELQSDKSQITIPEHLLALIPNYDSYDRIICGAAGEVLVCAPEQLGGRTVVAIFTLDELQHTADERGIYPRRTGAERLTHTEIRAIHESIARVRSDMRMIRDLDPPTDTLQ